MFQSILILSCLITLAFANQLDFQSEWNRFKRRHNKTYDDLEETDRYKIFYSNLEKIEKHNRRHSKGLETFTMGINAFTDLTFYEFSRKYFGYIATDHRSAPLIHDRNSTINLPETVDWREKGIVNEIKDQAACGSCWAFSVTASVEGAWTQAKGSLVSLSEQNLMDCSYNEGNRGCNGGLIDPTFDYIMNNGGIDTESSYGYTAASSKKCLFSRSNIGASITGYADIPPRDESALKNAVAGRVVSVAIHAGMTFQFYRSGIYSDRFCPGYRLLLNHAVAVVGYGTDHWIVRNSWGTGWGEKGYARFAMGKNLCGIATHASYPIV